MKQEYLWVIVDKNDCVYRHVTGIPYFYKTKREAEGEIEIYDKNSKVTKVYLTRSPKE